MPYKDKTMTLQKQKQYTTKWFQEISIIKVKVSFKDNNVFQMNNFFINCLFVLQEKKITIDLLIYNTNPQSTSISI